MLLLQNRTGLHNMSFGQIDVSIDGFDRSFCFMAFWLDMTCSEAGHRPVWSYVLRGSYVRYRDIRVALVLERRWHILCLSKHRCLWTRPLPYSTIEKMTPQQLTKSLQMFCLSARRRDGTFYNKSTAREFFCPTICRYIVTNKVNLWSASYSACVVHT